MLEQICQNGDKWYRSHVVADKWRMNEDLFRIGEFWKYLYIFNTFA